MSREDLYVGMMFKCNNDSMIGVCTSIKDNTFYFEWLGPHNVVSRHSILIDKALACFEYYGWSKLSALEEELV